MNDREINLGVDANGTPVTIDIATLISTRLLVTASSGGGKSHTLRRILEEAVGHIQCIVIDPEGEFSTLRERKPFVLVGEGGETAADVRTAALVATRILELNVSAVCDIYEMKIKDRHEWVKRFLEAMVQAPKSLWHPVLVIVDEAHTYAPEKGYGESVALQSMIDLANLGRKRGFCLIPATQRLSKLSKNVTEPMQNLAVGLTMFDDQERAAKIFKIKPGAETRAFSLKLEQLKPGQFIVRGRAFNGDMLTVQVALPATHPPAVGSAMAGVVTPTPETIRALLPKLADLPKEAEEKEQSEESLRRELREALDRIASLENEPTSKEREQMLVQQIQEMETELASHRIRSAKIGEAAEAARKLADLLEGLQVIPSEAHPRIVKAGLDYSGNYSNAVPGRVEPAQSRPTTVPKASADGLTSSHLKILGALAKLHAVGIANPARIQVALFSGYSNAKSGGFAQPMADLVQKGLAQGGGGSVSATPAGLAAAGGVPAPASTRELHAQLRTLLGSSEWKLLEILIHHYPRPVTRAALAEASGYSNPKSGGFAEPAARLTSLGLAEVPAPGALKGTSLLFVGR